MFLKLKIAANVIINSYKKCATFGQINNQMSKKKEKPQYEEGDLFGSFFDKSMPPAADREAVAQEPAAEPAPAAAEPAPAAAVPAPADNYFELELVDEAATPTEEGTTEDAAEPQASEPEQVPAEMPEVAATPPQAPASTAVSAAATLFGELPAATPQPFSPEQVTPVKVPRKKRQTKEASKNGDEKLPEADAVADGADVTHGKEVYIAPALEVFEIDTKE